MVVGNQDDDVRVVEDFAVRDVDNFAARVIIGNSSE